MFRLSSCERGLRNEVEVKSSGDETRRDKTRRRETRKKRGKRFIFCPRDTIATWLSLWITNQLSVTFLVTWIRARGSKFAQRWKTKILRLPIGTGSAKTGWITEIRRLHSEWNCRRKNWACNFHGMRKVSKLVRG